ncbi:MAG: thioredoxin-disulfide reductase [Deltaproteobacteria bacterium]|nr:thioredoxin-disulfide reductase [Deltaproteobacteria bacterium]
MAKTDYDLVIIGGGPAGLTAGLYAARARLHVVLLEKLMPGGQVATTDWIENYPGFPEGLSGADLVMKMTEQAKRFDLPIESREVQSLDLSQPIKKINLGDSSITTKTIIIATGASPRKLGVPGEDLFYGKGVSFCGTCDAPFYRDQVVAAVGGGDTAVQESIYLTKFVKKVYLIHRRDELRAAKILQERAFANDKIEIVWDSVVTSINGALTNVGSITLKNVKTGETRDLKVDGCFIWVGTTPNTAFLPDVVKRDDWGFIVTDQKRETSVQGVFAVGDVRDTPLRQVVTAVGDGAIAAVEAEHYIENME